MSFTFDGHGINGDDEHRSRLATLTNIGKAREVGPLLAAAPDLLQACEDALKVIATARQYYPKSIKNSDTFQLLNVEANSIRKAIAKAKGGERC